MPDVPAITDQGTKTPERVVKEIILVAWVINLTLRFVETCGHARWASYGQMAVTLLFVLWFARATHGGPALWKLAPFLVVLLALGILLRSVVAAKCALPSH